MYRPRHSCVRLVTRRKEATKCCTTMATASYKAMGKHAAKDVLADPLYVRAFATWLL